MQLKTTQVKAERERLQQQQMNICPLCQRQIKDPCLDHDHDTGYVRAVTCRTCNAAEGSIKKTLIRSGLVNMLGKDGALEFLEQLIAYHKADYRMNNLHPNHVKDELKRFSRLSKPEMEMKMQALGLNATGTKAQLQAAYKAHLQAL